MEEGKTVTEASAWRKWKEKSKTVNKDGIGREPFPFPRPYLPEGRKWSVFFVVSLLFPELFT